MRFIADFHIHSHFSIATSKQLVPEYLDYWARVKGLTVVGTGDFTHPGWSAELSEKLIPAEEGLFRLKDEYRIEPAFANDSPVRFMLTAEISNIYKKGGRVRKVHNVIFAPDFETVDKIQNRLAAVGNITSDGRPILGLDSRDLLEIALQSNENIFFVPAHIWTPWFSALGSKSGFDSIEECYADLAKHIFAVETGLSTDPPMNWMCGFLDKYTLLSNSDAHSPQKLGRNANIFDTTLSYAAITRAIKTADSKLFLGTIDLYPQEGKYHFDGHRKCNVRLNPLQTLKNKEICPVCGKKLTVGVLNRIADLADRENLEEHPKRRPFYSIIPLKEILAELSGKGENSKQVQQTYHSLIQKAGNEFNILLHLSFNELSTLVNPVLLEAIRRMRLGKVHIQEGYDGAYGRVTVFAEGENRQDFSGQKLFRESDKVAQEKQHSRMSLPFSLHEYRLLKAAADVASTNQAAEPQSSYSAYGLNGAQRQAVNHFRGPALVVAGPGTGKTRVLIHRMVGLIREKMVNPQNILGVTFTNKAAAEMKTRLKDLLPAKLGSDSVFIATFHAFCLHVLLEQTDFNFTIIDERERKDILHKRLEIPANALNRVSGWITDIKQRLLDNETIPDAERQNIFAAYEAFMTKYRLCDLDDLIYKTNRLFKENPQALQRYRQRFQWILVDEYQDINYAQYRLINRLCPVDEANLFVIGDPNQAIYGFRGADVQFIYRFIEDFPRARLYRLDKSYRCSQRILKASQNILDTTGSSLSALQQGVKIQIREEKTDRSEAEFIARSIEEMMGGLHFFSMDSGVTRGNKEKGPESLSEFAVLCRLKQQMSAIEKAFNDHRIPYQRVDDQSFFKQEWVKRALELLHLAQRPNNNYLQEKLISQKIIRPHQLAILNKVVSAEKTVAGQLELILNDFFPKNITPRLKDKKQLIYAADAFGKNWQEFLHHVALQEGADAYEYNVERVTLMTMHASKGLEFNCVFVAGCEQGILPYTLFEKQKTDFEEERRLLYVAMTRAQKYLFLSHARKRVIFGRSLQQKRSPFLQRIEHDLLEEGKNTHPRKRKRGEGQLNLFD